ncbi:MAG TPA: transposase, partial [Chromatiaceae bacterium]|nr:transposase [Chromatiaceae bacterium]
TQRQPPSDGPPSLDTMVRMVATLGGFLNRKHDAFPGPQTLWIGLQRTADFVLALGTQRSIGESDG